MNRVLLLAAVTAAFAAGQGMVIRTTTLIDGKGGVLRNQDIVVENGRIARVSAVEGQVVESTRLS